MYCTVGDSSAYMSRDLVTTHSHSCYVQHKVPTPSFWMV